jgi:Methyltransferase domain
VDALVSRGLSCLTVLDVSSTALARARERLGPQSSRVQWLEADVTGTWSVRPMDMWHDRAVFHFLTEPLDRAAYLDHVRSTLKPGGSVVLATFALDGPARCSGLPVTRYSSETLQAELGAEFELATSTHEEHLTPSGAIQPFTYSLFVRAA